MVIVGQISEDRSTFSLTYGEDHLLGSTSSFFHIQSSTSLNNSSFIQTLSDILQSQGRESFQPDNLILAINSFTLGGNNLFSERLCLKLLV